MSALGRLADSRGKITIAALDHRGSVKQVLGSDEELHKWKKRMVDLYKDEVSAVLIDPVYGKEVRDESAPCGWMVSLEKTGYRGGKETRVTQIDEGWGVKQAREAGYHSVKLLLYYDPENKELAARQKELAMRIAAECRAEGMIYLLEPLTYKVEDSREREVLKMVEELNEIPVDVWKLEYPGSGEACRRITEMVYAPWVLLSAGMEFDKYRGALETAMRAGASGFAVGRAVWQEFGQYKGEEREKYLTEVALIRMRELVEIVKNS